MASLILVLIGQCGSAQPAQAELGLTLSAASDDRFRGVSTSDRRPVGTFALSYDDAGGFYAGASMTGGPTRSAGLRALRFIQYAGYAHDLGAGVSIDIGVTNRIYSRYATIEYARHLAQGYVGVIGRSASAHLFIAPNSRQGRAAAYFEGDTLLWQHDHVALTAHLGGLFPPGIEHRDRPLVVDARISATRRLGRATMGVSVVAASSDERAHGWRQTLLFQVSRSF